MWSRSSSSASKSCELACDLAFLEARLHEVRELAEAHRTGHSRAALERVQRAPQARDERVVGGRAAPGAQLLARLREELRRFVEEDRQHLAVDVVANPGERIVLGERQRDLDGLAAVAGIGGAGACRTAPRRGSTATHLGRRLRRRTRGAGWSSSQQRLFHRGRFGIAAMHGSVGANFLELARNGHGFLDVAGRERRGAP